MLYRGLTTNKKPICANKRWTANKNSKSAIKISKTTIKIIKNANKINITAIKISKSANKLK